MNINRRSRRIAQAALGVLLAAGGAGAVWGARKAVTVEVYLPEPPKLNVSLTPSGGEPAKYDFEDGKTQCVVRRYTNPTRECTLSWNTENAESIGISPAQWTDDVQVTLPNPLSNPSGSYTFTPYQFMQGTTRHFTVKATNPYGETSLNFTIRRYSCFLAGTQVLMADGTYKNIEDVQAGDLIMSWDTQQGKLVARGVVARTERVEKEGYYVLNKDLRTTPMHLFYGNGDWKRTKDLKVGDNLLNPNGEPVPIQSIDYVTQQAKVYNLITEGPENYFVHMGNQDILAHNQRKGEQVPDKGLAAGTKVLLADGRYVPVEKVKVGDRLLAYDGKNRRYTIIRVRGTSNQTASGLLVINKKLKIGANHPIYSVDPKSAPKLPD